MSERRRKDVVDLDAINSAFRTYSERTSEFNQPIPTQGSRELDPRNFREEFPVDRPAVPAMVDQLPPEAHDGSILSTFASIADKIWPDDAGGLIRGTSGWLSNVPLYQHTLGAVYGAVLTGGAGAIDAMNWAARQSNRLMQVGQAGIPGGIPAIDWEQTQDGNWGQLRAADWAIRDREGGFFNTLINVALLPFDIQSRLAKRFEPENIMFSPDFDYFDEDQRREAFESGGWGTFITGYADAWWAVAGDPTIVLGGGGSVLRSGTKFGKFGGYTNQSLRHQNQSERFARTVDDQGELIARLGVDGARSSGRLTAEGENLIAALQGNADQLVKHPWVRGSANKRDATSLLASTSVDDPITAAYLVGAMAGDPVSLSKLRLQSADHYIAFNRAMHTDVLAPPPGSVNSTEDLATAGIRLTDDQIHLVDDMNLERLASRPELLEGGGQILLRGGSRLGPRTTRAANAWRTGATRNQFESNPFKKSPLAESSKSGHFVYDTIQGVAGSPPVEVIRWLGRGRPNGVVNVKDGLDGMYGLNEVTAWIRRTPLDQAQAAFHVNRFAAARTVNERTAALKAAEQDVFAALASQRGYTPDQARVLYNGYDRRRSAASESISKSETRFAFDETGKAQIYPSFYAELDQAFPLLDVGHVNEVLKAAEGLGKLTGGYRDLVSVFDYVNSLWKVSVLMRAGYTQRNFLDNTLRSFAVLGLITTNPKAFLNAVPNIRYYAKGRRGVKDLKSKEKLLLDSYEDLTSAREIVAATLSDARYPDLQNVTREISAISSRIKRLEKSVPATIPANVAYRAKVQKELSQLKARRDKLMSEEANIRADYYDPLLPEIEDAKRFEAVILKEIDDLSDAVLAASERTRRFMSKRKRGGMSPNVMDDGTILPGAFQGFEGEIAMLASSANKTVYNTFNAAAGRRIQRLEASADFKPLNPKELQPGQMQVYFDEAALRFNRRYREDAFGRRILESKSIDELREFFKTAEGRQYLDQLSTTQRPLRSQQDIDAFIFEAVRRIDYEVPAGSKLRELLLQREVTSAEVAAAMRGRDLPILPGRLEDGVSATNIFVKGKQKVDDFNGLVMHWLGTVAEDKLLRHPFYNNVYQAEQFRLFNRAVDQGLDVTSASVQRSINRSSHQFALSSTRETMYTIERLSNAAYFMRFISPFFPAWENAVRTWGRITWANPAVAGYGNVLWNIPNNLGMVIDKNGEPVDRSSMIIDEGHFVVWPDALVKVLERDLGPFNAFKPFDGPDGDSMQTRQRSFNVIFPGPAWWFSGVGPAGTASVSWFLRGKPEDAEVMRNFLGDELFRQFVPSGSAQGDIFDLLIPTAARRARMWLNGTEIDSAYVSTYNIMVEDEYIKAQLEDRTLTDADFDRLNKKFDKFWRWQMGSAVLAPFQFSRRSRFAPQRAYWNKLIDDTSLSYDQKVKALMEKFPDFGDALLPVTRSTSYTETKLRPNLTTWQRITKNPKLVDELYRIDPELVGMFGNMGTETDPWSYAVYNEFGDLKLGPGRTVVRRKMTAEELVQKLEVADGAREYRQVLDHLEERVIELGLSSLQVNDAQPLRDIRDEAERRIAERYPRWGQEREFRGREDKLPMIIAGARLFVENADLVNADSTISALWTYLQVRDEIAESISATNDRDEKEAFRQIGYEAAFQLRQSDIGFADFYDQFLFRDDFRRFK